MLKKPGQHPIFLQKEWMLPRFFDAPVKNPPNGHTGESRYPELVNNTGFRVKPGMTKEANDDFLQNHLFYAPNFSSLRAWARASPMRYTVGNLPRPPDMQSLSPNRSTRSGLQVSDDRRTGRGCQL